MLTRYICEQQRTHLYVNAYNASAQCSDESIEIFHKNVRYKAKEHYDDRNNKEVKLILAHPNQTRASQNDNNI